MAKVIFFLLITLLLNAETQDPVPFFCELKVHPSPPSPEMLKKLAHFGIDLIFLAPERAEREGKMEEEDAFTEKGVLELQRN